MIGSGNAHHFQEKKVKADLSSLKQIKKTFTILSNAEIKIVFLELSIKKYESSFLKLYTGYI